MSGKIRVLLVDDSVVIRRILTEALASHPEIEVVGTASNGSIALERVESLHPDLVVMDIEMPVMDGLETLKVMRPKHPKLPIIMFSTLTGRGAKATLEALTNGATDYVTKPANVGSVTASIEQVNAELVPRIIALAGRRAAPVAARTRPVAASSQGAALRAPRTIGSRARRPINAVVIGVSTGGPRALQEVIPRLPRSLRVPVLLVQHMPPLFTAQLASRLNAESEIEVVEAADGQPLRPGHVYVAPGDFHMGVRQAGTSVTVVLNQGPPEHSCRPAADVLFRSAADLWGASVFGVVMTGMGNDGALGAAAIVNAGGSVAIQDEASSVVWGMPGNVARCGIAFDELRLDEIGPEIAERAGSIMPVSQRSAVGAAATSGVSRP